MFSFQPLEDNLPIYHTATEHKEIDKNNLLAFDIAIQIGHSTSWKTFKALLDINSYVSLCLTRQQAEDLQFLPQESEEVICYADQQHIWRKPIILDAFYKPHYQVNTSIEIFLPENEAEKKKINNRCHLLHIMYDEDAKYFKYDPKNEVLVGRQFLSIINAKVEKEMSESYDLAFKIHPDQYPPDQTSKV